MNVNCDQLKVVVPSILALNTVSSNETDAILVLDNGGITFALEALRNEALGFNVDIVMAGCLLFTSLLQLPAIKSTLMNNGIEQEFMCLVTRAAQEGKTNV